MLQKAQGTLRKLAISVLGVSLPTIILTAVISEGVFRTLLFTKVGFMERLRKPELYFDYDSESNFWKLYYFFDGKLKPPAHPHPLLGWVGDFSRDTLLHHEAGNVQGRKAVLLYGDSFASCATPKEECFQGILNADTEFSTWAYLLNYGVGGYGVDQIFLLLKNTLPHFQNPFVIVSLLTHDLDRSALSVRVGQKPYFVFVEGRLVLRGTPVEEDSKAFFVQNPPMVPSYLFRLWVQADGWPQGVRRYFKGSDHIKEQKLQVNENLLLNIIYELRKRNLRHLFVIFNIDYSVQHMDWVDWQEDHIKRVLKHNSVPYISAREIIHKHLLDYHGTIDDYYIKGDGHPTALQNKVLANMIRKVVLDEIRDH